MSGSAAGPASRRLFIALNLPADRRAELHASVRQAVAPIVAAAPRAVSWVPEANLHVTLRFLGERPEALVPPLVEALESAASAVHMSHLVVRGLGAFPSLRRPRVLWMGAEMNVALAALYQKVDDVCATMGVPREARDFHPHVTVGRVRMGAAVPIERLAAAVDALNSSRWIMPLETVDLMSSELASGGSRYRRLAVARLSPAPGAR